MANLSPKIFLLGVGAQKAGTSWLHEQLNQRDDADFGFLKEYHILDAMFLDEFKSFHPQPTFPWKWRTWRRYRFTQKPDRYFNYFAKLLKRQRIKLTGDITPSYGRLQPETFQWVREQFRQRNIKTKAVFLMRDPIERILSQQRMKLRKAGTLEPENEIDQLRKAAAKLSRQQSKRSDYLSTLKNLKAAFGSDDLFVDLYENLFNKSTFQRLCDFLLIDYIQPDWCLRVNQSRATTSTPDDILRTIGFSQRDTYQGVAQMCPELNLEQLWPTASRWCR